MVWHHKKRITEREKLLISNCVGCCYLTSRVIYCNAEEEATETGTHLSNYAENIEDVSSDKDNNVQASDIVLADDNTVPNDNLEEISANDDKVFVLQIIEEKNMSKKRRHYECRQRVR